MSTDCHLKTTEGWKSLNIWYIIIFWFDIFDKIQKKSHSYLVQPSECTMSVALIISNIVQNSFATSWSLFRTFEVCKQGFSNMELHTKNLYLVSGSDGGWWVLCDLRPLTWSVQIQYISSSIEKREELNKKTQCLALSQKWFFYV